jgi:ribonucleoside-diphosphate reductase alpha chain
MSQPWYWVTNDTVDFMSKGNSYLRGGETVEQRVNDIAVTFSKYVNKMLLKEDFNFEEDLAKKFYDYMSRGFYSLASPVWSNFGRDGLPISCNNVYVPDDMGGILQKVAEVGMQTKHGAGTSGYLGHVRPRGTPIKSGGSADGPVHFVEMFQTHTAVISQGTTRRGAWAGYLDVEHPDIMEWLSMREEGSPIQDVSLGVCITDAWMESMLAGDKEKRKVWGAIIRKRYESGYPYIFWTDTVNNAAPDVYKDLGRKIYSSNLCSEIALSSNEEESFVCDLSSMNMLTYDDWKDTDAVEVLAFFLDAVMEEYIEKTLSIKFMEPARNFAVKQRALGIGTLGYHSLLQSKLISFESEEARGLNKLIHKQISEKALAASKKMAKLFGEPEMLKGYGRRNVTLMAIAPTTSSSFILGAVSPSIEPLASNYFTKDLAKGKYTYKNPYLQSLLETHGHNTEEVWRSILIRGGSVQHLDFLSEKEKEVFKTFGEISQLEVVIQAADRQEYIDQSQSLNITVHPNAPPSDVHDLLVMAWHLKVKTMYYQRSTNPAQELVRNLLTCSACEA